jgi:hypothetical protein
MEASGQLLRSRPLYPQGKSIWYPWGRRLGGPHGRSGHGGEGKNSQPLPGLEPPIIKPVAQRYTTEISWLLGCTNVYIGWTCSLDEGKNSFDGESTWIVATRKSPIQWVPRGSFPGGKAAGA